MSTEVKTDMIDHTLVTFWGGDERGVMAQVTTSKPVPQPPKELWNNPAECYKFDLQQEGFIQLTLSEAAALCNSLNDYVVEECRRRQDLLQKQIDELRMAQKNVFTEVASLTPDLFKVSQLSTQIVDKFCPITKEKSNEQAQ
jgi:hypothetical protein